MNFMNITETFKTVAQQYRKDAALAYNYIQEQQLYVRLHDAGSNADARDFLPLVLMMGVEGDTPEARAADVRQKVDHLTEVFLDPDPTRREKYLGMIFDLAEHFDPATVNMDDEKQVEKLLQCMLLDQAFAVERIGYPEFYSRRYPTKEACVVMDAKIQFLTAASAYVNKNLNAIRSPIESIATLPKIHINTPESVLPPRLQFIKLQRDQAVQNGGADIPSDILEVPILDAMLPLAQMRVKETADFNKVGTDLLEYYISYVISDSMLNSEKKEMLGYKEAKMTKDADAIYIDGMPYVDFLKKQLPKASPTDDVNARVLSTCLLNGQHQVDIVRASRDDNGVMQYSVKTLKPVLTDFQREHAQLIEKEHLKQYSWIRRTLFNWGPFRILPKTKDLDGPEAAKNRAKACAHLKERMETKIADLQEETRQARVKEEEKQKRLAKIDQEIARFDQTVDLWDKESVIGILGQQTKGTYQTILTNLQFKQPKDRYATVAEPLAKQVLYSQLMLERALSKDGQPGPIEKSLLGDGKPETIQKNIAENIQKIAQDPILKDLFASKVTTYNTLNRQLFEDMILNGGCQHFAMEYAKQRNEAEKTNQSEAAEKEMNKQNQKDLENQPKSAKKNLM